MKRVSLLLFVIICGSILLQAAQTFVPETGKYYFIKTQDRDNELHSCYLVENKNNLKFEFFYDAAAGKKDSAQWIIEYVADNGYTIKNKATGNYFTYERRKVVNGIKSNSSTVTDACYFDFKSITDPFTFGDFVKQGYGIVHNGTGGASLNIGLQVYSSTAGSTGTAPYEENPDFAWLFLTENEIFDFTDAYNKVNNLNSIADIAFDAFNKTFLVTKNGLQYYRESIAGGDNKDYFWPQALDIQMAEDVYLRTQKSEHATLIDNLLKAFIAQNKGNTAPGDWGWNEFNDDILWAGLAFARGYQITSNPTHLQYTKYAFELLYDTYGGRDASWDDELGGGFWWRRRANGSAANVIEEERAKSALSNSPAVILACYLYEFTEEAEYLEKAVEIMDWILVSLYDEKDGGVYENITSKGVKRGKGNVYTNGAFLGAATHIHRLTGLGKYYDAAVRSAEYVYRNRTTGGPRGIGGIMSHTKRDGTWQSEYCRGLGEFLRDNNAWVIPSAITPTINLDYYDFNKRNAEAAWSMRRVDLNITGNNWLSPMVVDDKAGAMECVGSVIIQQISPEVSPELKQNTTYYIKPKSDVQKYMYVDTDASPTVTVSTGEGTFKLISKGFGYYQIESVSVPGSVLSVNGTDLTVVQSKDDDDNQYWKLVYDYQGFHKLKAKSAPLMCLSFDGTKCSLKKEQYTDDERWMFTSDQGSSVSNAKTDGAQNSFLIEDNGDFITVREKTAGKAKIRSVQINDMYGRSVGNCNSYSNPVSEARLDAGNLISGIYILVINTDNNQKTALKFVKK